MADEKTDEKTVEVELLADGIRLGGVDYRRGDMIQLPEPHAKRLQAHGSVGPKGTIAEQDQARVDREEAEARYQRALTGLGSFDDGGEKPPEETSKPAPRASRQ